MNILPSPCLPRYDSNHIYMRPLFTSFLTDSEEACQDDLANLHLRYNLISWSRAIAFLAGTGLTWWGMTVMPVAAILVGALSLLGFLYLLKIHAEVAARRDHVTRTLDILREELDILSWNWLHRDSGAQWVNPDHTFSYDLDIFGKGSLFQYLHRHGTQLGGDRLAQWLQYPSQDQAEILARQEAVRELAEQHEWQIRFQARGHDTSRQQEPPQRLLSWMQAPHTYANNSSIRWILILLPGLFFLSLAGWIITTIPSVYEITGGVVIPGWVSITFFLLNLGISGRHMGKISEQQNLFAKKSSQLKTYAGLLKEIEGLEVHSPWLNDRKHQLSKDGESASNAIERLSELLYRLDQRLNIAAALLLNGTWLWDIRYMKRLEIWKAEYKSYLPGWLEVIADMDALNGLARIAAGRTDLVFPKIGTEDFHFKGQQLGHLLLHPEQRIDNEVEWSKSGEFLIVTGANMAGKSTFLRTVGTNLILGQIGSPVCAKSLSMVPIRMMTSIRATDSLTDHESYFYAELKRLKIIIDELKAQAPIFIIVDEMLRGTNSRDKQEGSRRFIEQLIGLKGVGMIATHDLSLGTLAEEYPEYARNKRFEVNIEGESLSFDYKLLDGVSQNLNATFLMQKMGIMPKE